MLVIKCRTFVYLSINNIKTVKGLKGSDRSTINLFDLSDVSKFEAFNFQSFAKIIVLFRRNIKTVWFTERLSVWLCVQLHNSCSGTS